LLLILRDRDLELTSGFNLELFDCILLVGRNDCSEALYFLADEIDRPRLALVGRYRAAPLTYFLLEPVIAAIVYCTNETLHSVVQRSAGGRLATVGPRCTFF
jgi:hypothetical protein